MRLDIHVHIHTPNESRLEALALSALEEVTQLGESMATAKEDLSREVDESVADKTHLEDVLTRLVAKVVELKEEPAELAALAAKLEAAQRATDDEVAAAEQVLAEEVPPPPPEQQRR